MPLKKNGKYAIFNASSHELVKATFSQISGSDIAGLKTGGAKNFGEAGIFAFSKAS